MRSILESYPIQGGDPQCHLTEIPKYGDAAKVAFEIVVDECDPDTMEDGSHTYIAEAASINEAIASVYGAIADAYGRCGAWEDATRVRAAANVPVDIILATEDLVNDDPDQGNPQDGMSEDQSIGYPILRAWRRRDSRSASAPSFASKTS